MWSLAEFQTLWGLVTSLGPGAQPPATKTLHDLNYGLISLSWCQMLLPIRGLNYKNPYPIFPTSLW